MEENISFEEWLKKNLASRKNTKLTKAEKKEAQDRDIMRALKNFINARTPEYIVYTVGLGGTKNELTYLAGHSKQAGVDKETVWDCSREFLKYIFPDFGRPCFISYQRKKRSPLSS